MKILFFHKKLRWFQGLVILTITAGALPVSAGELRDYSLPSQRGVPYEQQIHKAAPLNPPVLIAPEVNSVYDKFRVEIRALTKDQKGALKKKLEKKLREAATDEEQMYYRQLVAILAES